MSWETELRLRHVKTFLAIANGESVSLAAESLHVTQPAVSRTLRELEDMLEVKLFDRVGRGLRLNEAGRVFQTHAAASMVELARGRDRLSSGGDHFVKLSVGALPTASSALVPAAALAFSDRCPEARLHVLTGPNWLLFNQLRQGEVDLVVGRMPEGDSGEGLSFEQLYIEDVVVVCRPRHPLIGGRLIAEIGSYPLVLPPKGAVIAPTVDRFLTSIGVSEYRARFETVALPIGRKIVQSSDAIWFISRGVVADELRSGALCSIELASPLLAGPVGVSISTSAPFSVERLILIECLRGAGR
ncbi:HTH-type transcriptional regulator GbpR [Roseivivax sp. THAF30]|nr:HTH-type transcriptional regulator GbpR [Roseivivax sp. THAF30]